MKSSPPNPPRGAQRFLSWFIKKELDEEVHGDLDEQFQLKVEDIAPFRAKLNYWYQVLNYLRPFALLPFGFNSNPTMMFKHNFVVAMRSIVRNRTYTSLNILGLTVGMVVVLFIALWVQDELSFDKFHKNKNEIYRLIGNNSTASPKPLAATLKQDIPDICRTTRMAQHEMTIESNGTFLTEYPIIIEDDFFKMFSFPFVTGDENAFKKPSSIVITEDLAQRLFGNSQVIGEVVTFHSSNGNQRDFSVSGVMKNIPANSHINTSCFISVRDFWGNQINNHWSDWGIATYIQLHKGSDLEDVRKKINSHVIQYSSNTCDYKVDQLQNLKDIHLFSSYDNDYAECNDVKYVYILTSIAFFIVLIVLINYINLSNSLALSRLKEIGIRKVQGAKRINLIEQFQTESLFLIIISSIVSLIVLEISISFFYLLSGKILAIGLVDLPLMLTLIGSILIIGLIAGLFPTFSVISVKSKEIIHHRMVSIKRKGQIRTVLSVIQLCVTIIIIAAAVFIRQQMTYVQGMDIGFTKEQLVRFSILDNSNNNIETIKNELLKNPNISSVTAGNILDGMYGQSTTSIDWTDKNPEKQYGVTVHRVDYEFLNTYKAELVEGRFFSRKFASDSSRAFILNESAVKTFELTEPVGKSFTLWGTKGEIIGIIKDYNFETAHKHVSPVVLWMDIQKNCSGFESITARIYPENTVSTLDYAQKVFQTYNNGFKCEYRFMESSFENLYTSEKRYSSIFNFASTLAMFISCLGLLGYIIYSSKLRVKEIGIRKVHGANVLGIVKLLNREVVRWTILAFFVACPIVWFVMSNWLQIFAYRISLSWWVFLFGGGITLLFALLTVSWQSWKAAKENPVISLKYE